MPSAPRAFARPASRADGPVAVVRCDGSIRSAERISRARAPVRPSTSRLPSAARAVKPIISRSRSASELFCQKRAQGHRTRGLGHRHFCLRGQPIWLCVTSPTDKLDEPRWPPLSDSRLHYGRDVLGGHLRPSRLDPQLPEAPTTRYTLTMDWDHRVRQQGGIGVEGARKAFGLLELRMIISRGVVRPLEFAARRSLTRFRRATPT